VARFRPGVEQFGPRLEQLLQGAERTRLQRRVRELQAQGVPDELALEAASLLDRYSLLDCVQLAEETGEDLDDVVEVYFRTSESFSIDAMLGRVTKLPRENRWDALARGALRDDLYHVLIALTRSVLEVSSRSADPQSRLDEWFGLNADALTRARAALGGIDRLSHPGIAALSVALRTLRTVTLSAGPATGAARGPAKRAKPIPAGKRKAQAARSDTAKSAEAAEVAKTAKSAKAAAKAPAAATEPSPTRKRASKKRGADT
jgi:glutamate dehydrogenase